MARIKFHELYCSKCRMSWTALENQLTEEATNLPACRLGGAHVFTETIPAEENLANHPAHSTVQ